MIVQIIPTNPSSTTEETVVELDPEDQIDFDMFIQEEQNEDHCFAKVVNGKKKGMKVPCLHYCGILNRKNQNNVILVEMEATMDLLPLLWKSNTSFYLYSKTVKLAEHYFLGAAHKKIPT